MVWEAFKLHVRTILSSRINRLKASSKARLKQVSEQLDIDTREFSLDPTLAKASLLKLQTRVLDQLLFEKANQKLFFSRQRVFEQGERAGKLLAYLARQDVSPPVVVSLTDPQGTKISDPETVTNIFRRYYADLYSSKVRVAAQGPRLFSRIYPSLKSLYPRCKKWRPQ